MIKKNTKFIFLDGSYKGEYDWKGGIPLSEGENLEINFQGKTLNYKLSKKKITCNDNGEDQIVNIIFEFKLS